MARVGINTLSGVAVVLTPYNTPPTVITSFPLFILLSAGSMVSVSRAEASKVVRAKGMVCPFLQIILNLTLTPNIDKEILDFHQIQVEEHPPDEEIRRGRFVSAQAN